MKLEIWSDIACPWCYVGKRRFEQALASFPERDSLEITWRSFELDPSAPRVRPGTAAEHLAGKYRLPLERAEAMNANMTTQGAKEGIEFNFDRLRMGNTFDAHRLIHYAASEGRRTEMVERLFKAYFTEGAPLGDHEVLVTLAGDVGLDAAAARSALESGAFADAVRADEERARGFGITGVPFFAIDERYGISGAQSPEVILAALQQAWAEASPVETHAPRADGCEDGSCSI